MFGLAVVAALALGMVAGSFLLPAEPVSAPTTTVPSSRQGPSESLPLPSTPPTTVRPRPELRLSPRPGMADVVEFPRIPLLDDPFCPGALDPLQELELDQIAEEVIARRGLAWRGGPTLQVCSLEELVRRWDTTVEKGRNRYDLEAAWLRAVGLVDPEDDYPAAVRRWLAENARATYDPVRKIVVVTREEVGDPRARHTVARAVALALEDQWYDLVRPDDETRADERPLATAALAEGAARRGIGRPWEDRTSPVPEPDSATEWWIRGFRIVTELGGSFFEHLVSAGGEQSVARAWRHPPTTSEQLRTPPKYEGGEDRMPVRLPPAGQPLLAEGVVGEALTEEILRTAVDGADAERAARGWGGDWYLLWGDIEAGVCLSVAYVTDTEEDLEELQDAFDTWARSRDAAGARRVIREGDTLQVLACTVDPPPAGGVPEV